MTTQGRFDLKGLGEWLEQLAQAGENVDQAAQETIAEAAVAVQEKMLNLVPIDTGNLYNHIQIDGPYQEGNFSWVDVGVIHNIGFTDADTAIYGNVMEYGSARIAARPYIRPALKSSRGVVRDALKTVMARYGLKT